MERKQCSFKLEEYLMQSDFSEDLPHHVSWGAQNNKDNLSFSYCSAWADLY